MTLQPTATDLLSSSVSASTSTAQTAADPPLPARALRIALAGKGGAGKSVIGGTLARTFARLGHHVLALDVDTLPGLAFSLGLSLEEANRAGLPEDLAERVPERGWMLREGVEPAALVEKYAVTG